MDTLIINSEEDFKNFIDRLEDIIENPKDIELGKDFPQTLKIVITGGDFDGTITSSIMRGIIHIQEMIYKIHKQQKGRNLTLEEKQALEFFVSVKKGSGVAEILYGKSIEILVRGGAENMTGGQILAGILGVAAIAYIGRPIITGIFKNKQRKLEAKKSNHQHEAHRQAIDALKTVCLAQNKATSEFAKPEYDSITLQDETFTRQELKDYGKEPREEIENVQYATEGTFLITNINMEKETVTYITLKNYETEEIIKKVNIQDTRITEDDYKIMREALNRHSLQMQLIITEKDKRIIDARLDKFL